MSLISETSHSVTCSSEQSDLFSSSYLSRSVNNTYDIQSLSSDDTYEYNEEDEYQYKGCHRKNVKIEVVTNVNFSPKSVKDWCPSWYDHVEMSCQVRIPVRKTVKRDKKLLKTSNLPIIAVSNLRSLMPKVRNFSQDVLERQIGCGLLSEIWQKSNKKKHNYEIERMLHMKGLNYISTPRVSTKRGGGAAIVAPVDKYTLNKLDVLIPHNLEICWGLMRPKDIANSEIREYILASFYSPPKSRKKSKLVDHIITTVQILLTRYPEAGLIIGGDRNDLDIAPIISGIPRSQQIVNSPTINGKILDVIITNLYQLYHTPVVVPPIQPDNPEKGVPSDHSIPIAKPISSSKPTRAPVYQIKTIQPLPESGILEFGRWITQETWESLSLPTNPSDQVRHLEKLLSEKMNTIFPKKKVKLRPSDKPFIINELKILDRRKKREYCKRGKSDKFLALKKKFQVKYRKASQSYLENNLKYLKASDPSKYYSTLKKLGSQPGNGNDDGGFTLINHIEQNLTTEECTERIAQHFARISQEYPPNIVKTKFEGPLISKDIPVITPLQVHEKIKKSRKTKSQVPGDLPKKILTEFFPELAQPLCNIFQNIVQTSQWPSSWKTEYGIPIKKVKTPENEDELRIISLTNQFSKTFEQFVIDWLMVYVGDKIDPSQFGGIKGSSISHYLIEFTNFVLYNQDLKNPQAVLALLVDFSKAFNRQNHNIIIEILSDLGVPNWLLRLVASFLSKRELILRYKGKSSKRKSLPGGTPQGTKLGMFLFLILINFAGYKSHEVVSNLGQYVTKAVSERKPLVKKHMKYIDDMSIMASIDLKLSLEKEPNQIRPLKFHDRTGHKLPESKCEISHQLNHLENYVKKHQMKINEDKTKIILFNNSKKWDFTPSVSLGNKSIELEVVNQIKLLGIVITSDMKWHENTSQLCRKGFSRLWMLRNLKRLGASKAELLDVYIKQCRSILELAAPVWTPGLTSENIISLERVQKSACAIILGRKYVGYKDAIKNLGIDTLEQRRLELCLKFAKTCSKSDKFKSWFQMAETATVSTRSRKELYKNVPTRTERFEKSSIPFLTRLLNSNM